MKKTGSLLVGRPSDAAVPKRRVAKVCDEAEADDDDYESGASLSGDTFVSKSKEHMPNRRERERERERRRRTRRTMRTRTRTVSSRTRRRRTRSVS